MEPRGSPGTEFPGQNQIRMEAATKTERLILPFWGILALLAALVGVSDYELLGTNSDFGSEYGNIAQSLVQGNGFAGAFEQSAQPSSWMPPLLPVLMAAVFLLAGTKTLFSAKILVGLQFLACWGGLACLLPVAKRASVPLWPLSMMFGLSVWLNFGPPARPFDDTGLILLLGCLALLALSLFQEDKPRLAMLTAALLPLASPSLAMAFFLLVVASRKERAKTATVLACCLISLGFWTARNAGAFGAFVPVKSNLWFDFYQANLADEDGLVTASSFNRFHPSGADPAVLNAYRDRGEISFNEHYRSASLKFLQESPRLYLGKVLKRLMNATVLLHPVNDVEGCALTLPAKKQALLAQQGLGMGETYSMFWNCLHLEPEQAQERLLPLDRGRNGALYQDWKRARQIVLDRGRHWSTQLWGALHALVPFLAIVLGFRRRQVREESSFWLASGLYALYLAPYILISHYERYQIPLLGLSAFLVCLHLRDSGGTRSDTSLSQEA